MSNPFFTIIVPTRNRPEYVHDCIATVLKQTFQDFEIIVSDNGTNRFCDATVKAFDDKRIRYKRPQTPLGPCDNFEFAREGFRGDYIIVLGDKHRLYSNALEKVYQVINTSDVDVVSFKTEIYSVFDVKNKDGNSRNIQSGYLSNHYYTHEIMTVKTTAILEEKMAFEDPFGFEKGLIYGNSAYSRRIVEKVIDINGNGRFFDGMIADRYTSFIAMGMIEEIKYIDEPLSIYIRNGSHTSDAGKAALSSLENVWKTSNREYNDKDAKNYIPLPRCYGLVKNIQAGDYYYAISKLLKANLHCVIDKKEIRNLRLDKANFIFGVEDELNDISENDPRFKIYVKDFNKYRKLMNYAEVEQAKAKKSKKKQANIKVCFLKVGFTIFAAFLASGNKSNNEWKYRLCNKLDKRHTYVKDIVSFL